MPELSFRERGPASGKLLPTASAAGPKPCALPPCPEAASPAHEHRASSPAFHSAVSRMVCLCSTRGAQVDTSQTCNKAPPSVSNAELHVSEGTETARSSDHAWRSIGGWRARCGVHALRSMLGGLLAASPCFAPASLHLSGQAAVPVRLFLACISVIQHRSCDGHNFRRPAGKLALIGLDRLESCLCRCAAGSESWSTEQRCMLGVCIGAAVEHFSG